MPVTRECDDCRARFRHDQPRILPLRRLTMEVGHRPGVPGLEPPVERLGVRIRLERRDPDRIESQFEGSALQLDADVTHTPLLDVVSRRFLSYNRIVSLLHRANLTTSSTEGTASSSPYAVNMRHRTYAPGGSGRNGA